MSAMTVVKAALDRTVRDMQAEQADGRNVGQAVEFLQRLVPQIDRPLDMFWTLKAAKRKESEFIALRRS